MANRKSLALAALLLIHTAFVNAQVLEPVAWSFKSEKTAENNYDIVMTATIDNTWHLYAMDLPEEGRSPPVLPLKRPWAIPWKANL